MAAAAAETRQRGWRSNRAHKKLVKGEQVVRKLGKCVALPIVDDDGYE